MKYEDYKIYKKDIDENLKLSRVVTRICTITSDKYYKEEYRLSINYREACNLWKRYSQSNNEIFSDPPYWNHELWEIINEYK